MTEAPDRLSVEPGSPYYNPKLLRKVEVYLNGEKRKNDVIEYCVSEGWMIIRIIKSSGYGRFAQKIIHRYTLRGEVTVKLLS